MNLGPTELLIVLAIVVILFGVGRVARIGGELGQAVGNFREGIRSAEDTPKNDEVAEENASARLKASE